MQYSFDISAFIDLGSIVALIGVPYLIIQNRLKRRHFSYDFSGSSGQPEKDKNSYTFVHEGTIKNISEAPNSIVHIYLLVWKNQKRNSFLRNGYGGVAVFDVTANQELRLPIYFLPREAKRIKVSVTFPVNGTSDEKILKEVVKISPDSEYYLPKYTYELAFEDIDKNFFDQSGRLRNIDEANLWWTIGNTYHHLDNANPIPYIKHLAQILYQKVNFFIKLLFWKLGL